uniref:Uncharacterized protein n=1 Tax=Rhizophora mucronata TaxID=61149 RepID=A0A2P2PB73_RHIMU
MDDYNVHVFPILMFLLFSLRLFFDKVFIFFYVHDDSF